MLAETRSDQLAITPILDGILEDGRDLIRQEVALVKSEVRHEVSKFMLAGVYFVVGAGLSLIALILLAATLANFLSEQFPSLPLWQSYGIVTLVLGAAAALFMALALSTTRRSQVGTARVHGTKNATTLKQ